MVSRESKNLEFGKHTLEEIHAIPTMLSRTLKFKDEIQKAADIIAQKKNIHLTGDGTSYHAGFVSSYTFNNLAKIKTYTDVSPEFGYLHSEVLDKDDDIVIGISQSGESEMTLQAVKDAKEKGISTMAITNDPKSNLAKISDFTLELRSGVEKSVLATKTYINTIGILNRLAIEVGYVGRKLDEDTYNRSLNEINSIPTIIESTLPMARKQIRSIAPYFKFAKICFVLGSGPDYGLALEASLKLKEGAQILSQAYSTAEFPHGPITLADSSSWILALIPAEEGTRRDIILKLLRRVKERSATITGIFATPFQDDILDMGIHVPKVTELFQPFIDIIPVQLLSVELAIQKGINPDKPKFLTKISGV
ncbi:MAG: SIS domain-containing protein [archaeon]|nr:SIS domain-containing protein [archaeon]